MGTKIFMYIYLHKIHRQKIKSSTTTITTTMIKLFLRVRTISSLILNRNLLLLMEDSMWLCNKQKSTMQHSHAKEKGIKYSTKHKINNKYEENLYNLGIESSRSFSLKYRVWNRQTYVLKNVLIFKRHA